MLPTITKRLVEHDIRDIALIIAQMGEMDGTSPTPQNRDAWKLDFELRTRLERPLGHELHQWEQVLDICQRANKTIQHTGKSITARALIVLNALNAARRLPNPSTSLVEGFIGETRTLLSHIERGTRRDRLESLLVYHLGIWARTIGDYQLSVEHQIRSAEIARKADDAVGEAIAQLCEQVGRLSLALVDDAPFDLAALHQSASRVVTVCLMREDQHQRFWGWGNAPIHVFLAHIWTKDHLLLGQQQYWWGLLHNLEVYDKAGYQSIEFTITAVVAGLALMNKEYERAIEIGNTVIDASGIDDDQALMTAYWVVAQAHFAMGSDTKGKQYLRAIIGRAHTMQQLRSVAQREEAKRSGN